MSNLNNNIDIRKIDESCIQLFKETKLEALKLEPQAFGEDYETLEKKKENFWKKYISNRKQVWYGAFANNEIVGIGSIKYAKQKKFSHIAHLSGIYVKQEYRGQGIGRMLFEKRIAEAFLNPKVVKLKLIVNTSQTNAINLYKSCGFEIVGEMKKEFKIGQNYYNAYLMELLK